MTKKIIGLSSVLAGSLCSALWVDEEALKHSIQNMDDYQSKIIYARYLMEHNRIEDALGIVEGIDQKEFPNSIELQREIIQYNEDGLYLKKLQVNDQKNNIAQIASGLNPQESQRFYFALKRHHIPLTGELKKILGNNIAQGSNKLLAGVLLYGLPELVSSSSVVESSNNIILNNNTSTDQKLNAGEPEIQNVTTPKSTALELQEALIKYEKKPFQKEIQTVLYLFGELGQEQQKIIFLKQHILKYPFDYETRLTLGKHLAWNEKYEDALDYLHMVDGKFRFEAQLLSAQIYSWKGEYERAKVLLNEIVHYGDKKNKYEAQKVLGFIAGWQGESATAREIFLHLNRLNPEDKEVQDEVWFYQKRYKPLIAKYQRILQTNTTDTKAMAKIASLYKLDKQEERAIYYLEQEYALTQEPELLKEMGNIALSTKQNVRGINYWRAYAMKVNSSEAWFEYAQNLSWIGQNKKAIEILRTIQNDPSVSQKVKELMNQLKPSLGMKMVSVFLTLALSASLSMADAIDTTYAQDIGYAEYLEKEQKYAEASSVYRMLYLKTSDSKFAQKYVETLHISGRHEEADIIASVLGDKIVIPIEYESVKQSLRTEAILNEDARELDITKQKSNNLYKIGFAAHRLADTEDLSINSAKVIGAVATDNDITIHAEVGTYKVETSRDYLNGKSAFVSAGTKNYEVGMLIDTVGDKTEFNPYARISYNLAPHTFTLSAYRRNIGFMKYAIAPFKNHNTLTSVVLSDYALFENNDEFWGSLEVAWDENNNMITTPQFQYRFFQTPLLLALYSLSVDGWYIFNSKPTSEYYSPRFSDGTYIANNIEVPLWEKVQIKIMGGLGYSYEGKSFLYKYGAWIERPLSKDITFRLGCADFNAMSAAGQNIPYSYNTCDINFLYHW